MDSNFRSLSLLEGQAPEFGRLGRHKHVRGGLSPGPACSPIAIQFGEELTFERGGARKRAAHHPANKNRLAAAGERGGGKSAPRARGMEWPRAPAVVVSCRE